MATFIARNVLGAAPASAPAPTVWILTDGKAGDEQPLIGIAEAMGADPIVRRVSPRAIYAALMPFGPVDPNDDNPTNGPLARPYPDICLATGRRAVTYLRTLKRRSPSTFTVFVKDPRTRWHGADLVFVQLHDTLRGKNVEVHVTGPHRQSHLRLAAARDAAPADLLALPHPRVAVLVGGDSRHHRFGAPEIDALVTGLRRVVADGASLMITTSRRTPPDLVARLADLAAPGRAVHWSGGGWNPLSTYLALADAVVVTADSTNMVGEAAVTGMPIHVFHPAGGHAKTAAFLEALGRVATLRPFPGPIGGRGYAPVDATPEIARMILARWREGAGRAAAGGY